MRKRKLIIASALCMSLAFTSHIIAQEPATNNTNVVANVAAAQHIVKPKETLSGIASKYKVNLNSLISLNKITDPRKLQIGQVLTLPGTNATAQPVQTKAQEPVAKAAPQTTPQANGEKYIVKPGDTLSRIAIAKGTTVQALVQANNLANPNVLKIGQVLNLSNVTQTAALASRSDTRPRETNSTENNTNNGSVSEKLLSYAKSLLGKKYSYGASGPNSFDCSGFTMYVYKHIGISLPHQSGSQSQKGTKVEKNNLIPGDLVFFNTNGVSISHVGIYVGNGNFIHASSGGGKIEITSLSSSYYVKRYVTARRIIN